jgi:hypothetical protein
VQLDAKIAHLNKLNKIYKSYLKLYVVKRWQIHLLHLRKNVTKNKCKNKCINKVCLEWMPWKESIIVLNLYYETEHVDKRRV